MPPNPIAPNNPNTLCIPIHWSRAGAVDTFKDHLKDCPDVWHYGQFVWSQMLRLRGRPGTPKMGASAYYQHCMNLFNNDKLAEIEPWIIANGIFDDKYLTDLFELSKDGCFDYVGHVARFLERRGGIKGCRARGSPWLAHGTIYRSSETLADPWYQMVRYDKATLAGLVSTMKTCLDDGFVVRAGVASGLGSSNLANPEHYVLILGYDDDEFVFWDTDAFVSNRPVFGPAFGTLTYRHPGDPGSDKFHRLTTSKSDEELKCNTVGNFTLTTPSTIANVYRGEDHSAFNYGGIMQDFRQVNHRYQVTYLMKL